MTKRILVLGMNSFDSGKTVLSRLLAESLLQFGHNVEYFKPLSGHNYWYRYDHTRECIDNSALVSRDAIQVRGVLKSSVAIEIANPIHSLLVPMILSQPKDIIRAGISLGGWDSVLAMQRFTRLQEKKPISITFVAQNLIESGALLLNKVEMSALAAKTEMVPFESFEEIESYSNTMLEPILTDSLHIIEREADVVIIEGFNDSVWPWEGLESVDYLFVTGPGHVFAYDPERFRKASFLVKYNSQPIREVPFSRVNDMINPIRGVHLRPQDALTTTQLGQLGLDRKERLG
ncbi:MAG: hypothetical protein ACFFEF_15150 [Candidatus Thorarchaeota archaeon]